MVNLVVGVAEQVAESDDRVLAVLDEMRLGAVADVDLLARVGDRTRDLTLSIFVGDAVGVTLLGDDRDRGVRLAEIDTENDRLRPGRAGEGVSGNDAG